MHLSWLCRLAILMFVLVSPCWVTAQPAPSPSSQVLQAQVVVLTFENAELRKQLDQLTSEAGKSYSRYLSSFYDQATERGKWSVDVYRWQSSASDILMFLTAIITLAGVAFCGWQLYTAARVVTAGAGNGENGPVMDLSVEASKIQLKTSAIGLAVLTISCVYLYLFLKEVYPVQPACAAPAAGAVQTPLAKKP